MQDANNACDRMPLTAQRSAILKETLSKN